MVLNPLTLAAELERFLVPQTTQTSDPPLGWPDGVSGAPPATTGVTSGAGLGPTTFRASGLTPGAFAGGYASVPPYWEGAQVVSNTDSLVTMATPASSPSGPLAVFITATAANQLVYTIPNTSVALVQSVRRTSPTITDLAIDATNGSYDPENGVLTIYDPDDAGDPAIATNDVIEFVYLENFSGVVPAGEDYTLIEPPSNETFSTGAAWADAYEAYIAEGAANGISPTSLTAAKDAMKPVVDGMMAVPGLANLALASGMAAFWGVLAASAPVVFPTAITVIPPPGLAGIPAAITAAGLLNTALGPNTLIPWSRGIAQAAATNLATTGIHAPHLTGPALVVFPVGTGAAPFPFL